MNIIPDNNLKSIFDIYIDECRYTRGLSIPTIISYEDVINFFFKMMPEIETPEDINVFTVNEFFKRITNRIRITGKDKKKKGLKPSTILSYYTRIFTFIKWLETHDYIEKDSITTKLKKPLQPVYDNELSLSKGEVSQIVSAITFRNISNDFLRKRDLLIISLFLYTGMRRGELLGLQVEDIDFVNKQIRIRGITSKSKKGRTIPLHPKLTLLVKNYLLYRKEKGLTSNNLFISENNIPITGHGLKHWVKRYIAESGVSFHLHRFRHTFACTMAKNGADIISIKNMLGHSTVKMTERYLRSIKSEHSRNHIESLSF